jgi:hypothetical protein
MATFYKEGNDESTEELYDKTIIYISEMQQYAQKYASVVDFTFAEKALYGKVDRDFISIEPNVIGNFKRIPNSEGIAGSVEVFGFVADAFAGLSRHFERSTQIGAIRKNDPYLSSIKAFSGYVKPQTAYNEYFRNLSSAISQVKEQKQIKIKNFEDFVHFYLDFSKSVGKRFPITKTGFVRSRFNSLMNSGLSIEVTDIVYENDNEKIESFVSSPNFEYYLNACNSYGFMVDRTAPWRMIADIDSVAMQGYASRYSYRNTDAILLTAYKKSHHSALRQMPQQMLQIYNNISEVFTESELCNGKTKTYIVEPEVYNLEKINNLYDQEYFIRLYCMLRFTEEETKHSEATQKLIITDTINLSRVKDLSTALGHFERFVSQPFDYRGSLSYLTREAAKREDK